MTTAPWNPTEAARALVFGGSGYLGTHVAAELRAAGFAVTATSRQRARNGGLVSCDPMHDPSRVLAALIDGAAPRVVINCIGSTTGTATEMVDANITVPARLLEAVAIAAPHARIVHLGSAGEYGAVPAGQAVDEDAPCEPTSPYGVSKLAGTRLLMALSAEAGVDTVVLRVFNPIGPGAPPSSLAGRAARLLHDAARQHPHPDISMASLDSHRDWVDARDVGRAVFAAARAPEDAAHHVYNVGSGHAVHTRQVVELIARAAGFRATIREDRTPPARSGSVSWQQAEISLAERDLGWRPRYSLADSVAELCRSLG